MQLVKSFFGETFSNYFTHMSTARSADSLEFIHYSDILFDKHFINRVAYGDNKEPHVYALLGRIASNISNDDSIAFHL